jgi:hypothetical protein
MELRLHRDRQRGERGRLRAGLRAAGTGVRSRSEGSWDVVADAAAKIASVRDSDGAAAGSAALAAAARTGHRCAAVEQQHTGAGRSVPARRGAGEE